MMRPVIVRGEGGWCGERPPGRSPLHLLGQRGGDTVCRVDSPPLRAARALRAAGHAVTLLLSAQAGPYGRRSLLAIDPDDTIVSPPGAGAGLPAIPPRLVHAAHGRGVWIGAVSYDAGLGLLGHLLAPRVAAMPALVAGYHATYASYDHDGGRVVGARGTAGCGARRPGSRRGRRAGAARRGCAAAGAAHGAQPGDPRRATRRPAARCSGSSRSARPSRSTSPTSSRRPWDAGGWALFERLLDAGPGDHAAFLALGGVELASVSPELFLRIEDGVVETRPIKGTRPPRARRRRRTRRWRRELAARTRIAPRT